MDEMAANDPLVTQLRKLGKRQLKELLNQVGYVHVVLEEVAATGSRKGRSAKNAETPGGAEKLINSLKASTIPQKAGEEDPRMAYLLEKHSGQSNS